MTYNDIPLIYIGIGAVWFVYALFASKYPPEGFLIFNTMGWPIPLFGHVSFLIRKKDNKFNFVRDYSVSPSVPTRPF